MLWGAAFPGAMINVNKLFPRLSIRAKLVIAFCVFGVVPVGVVGGYGAVHSFLLLTTAVQERLGAGVTLKADEIRRGLVTVRDDVRFLSRLPTLQQLVNLPPDRSLVRERLVARLGDEFLAFSRSRTMYYQVRLIDERGREIVRADFDGAAHFLVPREALQDKSDRYYFREAMATPPGAIYVSPMDLNVEGGVVERPHKPVVRYAVTLRNEAGAPRGIVIVNVYASHILGQVLALGHEVGEVSLASSAGDYLSRSQWLRAPPAFAGSGALPFPPWLASYSERVGSGGASPGIAAERLVGEFAADVMSLLLSGKGGTVIEPGLDGRLVAYAPIFPRGDGQGEFWVLIHTYRKAEALASIRSLQSLVLGLGLGVFVIALVLGVAAARHFTRPITELARGADAVARGEFEPPIRVETNDELEDLARQFSGMARRLQEHETQLLEARERAARLEERERIAEDLHDGIIQSIYATGLSLEECTRLAQESPQEVGPRLESAIEALNGVIRDVRNYVVGLQPGELRERGLSGALADLARGLALNALLNAELDVASAVDERLTPDQTHHLFHICREVLTNVVKHAQASRVLLSLQLTDGVLRLSVEDDGTGFDPDRRPASGRGLRNVAERVRRLGGSLSIESTRGRGTRVVVEAPLEVTT